jgi:hypothetical protein
VHMTAVAPAGPIPPENLLAFLGSSRRRRLGRRQISPYGKGDFDQRRRWWGEAGIDVTIMVIVLCP